MDCKKASGWIHEYLDGNLDGADSLKLKEHLIACPDCKQWFNQMERTEAMVRSLPRQSTPDGLTSRIMASLPEPSKTSRWIEWIKRHPAISVASVFLLVMLSSFLTLWNQDTDLVVKGKDLDQVIIQGNTVYVPSGHTVVGDLMIKNGNIQIDGDIQGSVFVIDGNYQLASTASISGQIKEIDQALGWLWFKLNEALSLISK
ncbi:zf-HC2 domain-containing protein [Paenibacillus sp. J2TS4]|uniref:zf-HC2 domain-containing protein n=1 Tax=Paenibacillus sp. J2TS4 TaxID=2807194 RepID=UPI001B0EED17|nr:zf-HC2 domain-containing protein [Paenibacillus sp. J2TS4]GIP34958.1 hypothetical protein J2TS4_41680 [Paenibacillus sp. J2TS4]